MARLDIFTMVEVLDLWESGIDEEEILSQYPKYADELRIVLATITHLQTLSSPPLKKNQSAARAQFLDNARDVWRWN